MCCRNASRGGNSHVIIHLLACKNNDQIAVIGVGASELNNDIKRGHWCILLLFLFKEQLNEIFFAATTCESEEDVKGFITLNCMTRLSLQHATLGIFMWSCKNVNLKSVLLGDSIRTAALLHARQKRPSTYYKKN